MSNILLDAAVAFSGDTTKLDRDVQGMSGRMKSAFNPKVIMGGLAVAGATVLAVGTKGVLELDTAMADFQATTGATEDDVKSASDAVLDFSRRNLQPISEITETMGALRTELGLNQEAAEGLTEKFLDFSQVTGQDGASAVSAFDDILDAWGLDATESAGIMDQLIASHQKYGGSVVDNQAALAAMAPAMTAANFEMDDGIGLLNMFAASGVDANTAQTAFSKALATVESPEELQRMIDDISGTLDPFERAQKAADLFGAKAGPKMATLLAPGTESVGEMQTEFVEMSDYMRQLTEDPERLASALENEFGTMEEIVRQFDDELGLSEEQVKKFAAAIEEDGLESALADLRTELGVAQTSFADFVPSAEEAAGATDEAATAFESSFGRQMELWMNNAKGLATELVSNLGPGVGGLAMAGATLGPALMGAAGAMKAFGVSIFTTALPAIWAFMAPLLPVIAIIAALIAIGTILYLGFTENFLGIRDIAETVFTWLTETFQGLIDFVLDIPNKVAGFIGGILAWAESVRATIATKIGEIIAVIGGFVDTVLAIPGKIGEIVGKIGGIIGDVVGKFLAIPGQLVDVGADIVSSIMKGLASLPGKIWDSITGAIRSINIDIGPFHISGVDGITVDMPDISIPGFASGTPFLEQDGIIYAHKGERIDTAADNAALNSGQAMLLNPALLKNLDGGGKTINVNVFNPVAEPASKVGRRMQELAELGTL